MSQADASDTDSLYDWSWFARGMALVFSLPALILISAFVGFGGLAREAGISLGQLIFMVPTVWALPSHLILVSGISAGVPLLAIIPAVALAAVRMMPMTMALVPEIRLPGSKTWHLLLVSNMINKIDSFMDLPIFLQSTFIIIVAAHDVNHLTSRSNHRGIT